jgi:signal transduction histidine kinase
VTEVRTLVKGLTPLPLEQEAGLISALEDLAEQVRVIGKVKCTFKGPKSADFLEPSTSVHLYRIAQEAAHNAVKHAQAKRIQIKLTVARKELVLTVLDDGIGFAQQRTTVPSQYSERSSGLGLHIMNYRARAIGGRLEINKLPGKGTAVVCTLLPKELAKKRGNAAGKGTSAKSVSFSI